MMQDDTIQDNTIQDDTMQADTQQAASMHDDTAVASFSMPRRPGAMLPAGPPTSSVHAAPSAFRCSLYGIGSGSDDGARAVVAAPAARRQPGADQDVFYIRLAQSSSHHHDAAVLIRKRYSWRGYAAEQQPRAAASGITLVADCGGVVVGTMGLCLDGCAGLPADDHFRPQLDLLRGQGLRLCEPSRLAIDGGVSKRVFASLIHVSYLYAHVLQACSDYIIEVHPRHLAFYQRMLGFEQAGPVLACSRVGAPAVLLRLSLYSMGEHIRACGGRTDLQQTERSFYPYFFSPDDEAAICQRLLARRERQ
ncbi:N-acyl amino acid synthase FeeM domain-containing protein [Massilia sp. PWRC2]|uniref:N-acyl amino acid synthase FeeM domain-containing protein n=1 Tax=Massilia sp. PWRC2 TaxID=2804626 RepID=UPI003CED9283